MTTNTPNEHEPVQSALQGSGQGSGQESGPQTGQSVGQATDSEQPQKALHKESPAKSGRSLFSDPVPWLLLLGSLGLDQLSKALVIENLVRGESWPEDGFFRITHAWNTGTAFSLFQDQSSILTFVSFGAVIALYFVYRSVDSPTVWVRMAFGLLLGGAFGNLIDRVRLGHVTDFVDVGSWPIFNVADSSILVGIFVLFLFFWTSPSEKDKKDEQATPGSTPGSSSGTNPGDRGNSQETG